MGKKRKRDRERGGPPGGTPAGRGGPGTGRPEAARREPGPGPAPTAATSGSPAPPAERTSTQVALDWAKSLGIALVLFLVLRTFLVQTFVITSSSMEETLLVGDFLILSKLAYGPQIPLTSWRLPGYTRPERNDIAVFRPPHDPGLDVVKRLVGAPGDTLRMIDKVLYINGVREEAAYLRHSDHEGDVGHPWMRWQCGDRVGLSPDISGAYRVWAPEHDPEAGVCRPTRDNWGPIVIPPGHFFTIGDNRDDSIDSRHWGFLSEDRLRGEALILYYSYDPQLRRPFAFLRNIRPDRIGNRIR